MNKIKEIFEAWKIAYNPTEPQTELAGKRLEICLDCEHRATIPFQHCSICKCPLDKKIYSPNIGSCPKNKWIDVETEWNNKYKK